MTPFKWVGSKERVKNLIVPLFPEHDDYYEPFLGSAAIFLHYLTTAEQKDHRHYYLSDINADLINTWIAIQNHNHEFCRTTEEMAECYNQHNWDRSTYHQLRDDFNVRPKLYPDSTAAAMFFTLLRTSFNGLIRYSKAGKFNAAWGARPMRFDRKEIEAVHELIANDRVHFETKSFEQIEPKASDFVFADPPYIPLGDRMMDKLTYSKEGFENHQKLANCASQWGKAMICNHDSEYFRELFPSPPYQYLNYDLKKVFTGHVGSRKATTEILAYK
jgi:DNA adenine methylase